MPPLQVPLAQSLARIVPICFCVGAGMEFFMVQTGFYRIVTELEGKRRGEREAERQLYLEQKQRRRAATQNPSIQNKNPSLVLAELVSARKRLETLRALEGQLDLRSTVGKREVQLEVRKEKTRLKELLRTL
jgi:hypothetical protein